MIKHGDIVLMTGVVEPKIVLVMSVDDASKYFDSTEGRVVRFNDYGLFGFVMEEDCEVVSDADIVAARLLGIPLWVGVESALREAGRL